MTDTVQAAAPRPVRPFLWSVRRELWENRAVLFGPAAVGAVVLAAFLYASRGLVSEVRLAAGQVVASVGGHFQASGHMEFGGHEVTRASAAGFGLIVPYLAAGAAILLTAIIVGVFYALGALHGERRDRSVLFWKSLPVSDLITVLSKAVVPLIILPLAVIGAVAATHLLILAWSLIVLSIGGIDPSLWWPKLHLMDIWPMYAWSVAALTLWWAPVVGWLMLVSAWAKRVTFLWAVLPPLGLALFERVALGTDHIGQLIGRRLAHGLEPAFDVPAGQPQMPSVDQINVGGFFATPGVWGGLVVLALCLAGCVWLRRRADPI